MSVTPPNLTFACELEAQELQALFDRPEVIPFLQAVHATVSLGILDLSETRANVVRQLTAAGIPVTAWLLLPKEQGYWFNLDNYLQATARYEHFYAWSLENGLRWARIGLDIEPDIRSIQDLSMNRLFALIGFLRRAFDNVRLLLGQRAYHKLVEQIHAHGYEVETYQFPLIIDERIMQSSMLQRLTGLVDLPEVDHEVLMLYSSFMRPWGQGMLWSYAPFARGVGVGSTGGGVELKGALATQPLNWAELETDLIMARRHTENIFIFSLEGCVAQNFLPLLQRMDWQAEGKLPALYASRVDTYRKLARRFFWLASRPAWLLFLLALGISALTWLLRKRKHK